MVVFLNSVGYLFPLRYASQGLHVMVHSWLRGDDVCAQSVVVSGDEARLLLLLFNLNE